MTSVNVTSPKITGNEILQYTTQNISLCKCSNECLCMEMCCNSCCISGIIFHATDPIKLCLCNSRMENYCKSDRCRCDIKCICMVHKH